MSQHVSRIAVVGPTYPLKGGIAAHTTELARQLAADGHDVELVSWSRLYPGRLYPGEQEVPAGEPDLEPFPHTSKPLAWNRPDSWVRTGRRLRKYDVVVIAHVATILAPAYVTVLKAAGARPRRVVVAHNVLPHEHRIGDAVAARALFRRADTVVVHSREQAEEARRVTGVRAIAASTPPHLPSTARASGVDRSSVGRHRLEGAPLRLLSFGVVRPYKGIDVLLEALGQVPDVELTVAGEFWGDTRETLRRRAADLELAGRVTLHDGYVPASELPALFAAHDVLMLPYRSATASQNVQLGHAFGLPVVATTVGTFPNDIREGIDGLLIPPDDPVALAAAIQTLTDPVTLARLQAGVDAAVDFDAAWAPYLAAVLGDEEGKEPGVGQQSPAQTAAARRTPGRSSAIRAE